MTVLPRSFGLRVVLVLCACGAALPCQASDSAVSQTLDDAKLYFTAPLHWDERNWAWFGGSLLAIGAAHEYDANVRRHFGTVQDPASTNPDPHDSRDWAPAAAIVGLTWAYATFIDSRDGYDEGRAMLESAAFSAASGTLLKLAAGRRRPTETPGVDDWRNGGSSFPSMHATVTFAVGTVLAESGNDDYRWIRRFLGYGLAAGTSYSRVHDGVHWLSDVVAGAALGAATGNFVVHRHDERYQHASLAVLPLDGGAMITYTIALH
jgi:membrane-associated phospholipid phosphatase